MTENDTPAHGRRSRRAYHERLVAAFVAHTRVEDVAKAVCVSVRTAQRWRAIPENWRDVEAARAQVLGETLTRLRNELPQVASRLVSVALSEIEPAAVAVRAATVVFATYTSLSERVELDRRMSVIEDLLRSSTTYVSRPAHPLQLTTSLSPEENSR